MNLEAYFYYMVVMITFAIITFTLIGFAIIKKDFSKRMDRAISIVIITYVFVLLLFVFNTKF